MDDIFLDMGDICFWIGHAMDDIIILDRLGYGCHILWGCGCHILGYGANGAIYGVYPRILCPYSADVSVTM